MGRVDSCDESRYKLYAVVFFCFLSITREDFFFNFHGYVDLMSWARFFYYFVFFSSERSVKHRGFFL